MAAQTLEVDPSEVQPLEVDPSQVQAVGEGPSRYTAEGEPVYTTDVFPSIVPRTWLDKFNASTPGRIAAAVASADPLAQREVPWGPGRKPPNLWEEIKSTLSPGPGDYGPGNPLNLIHAIPMIGPGVAQALSQINPEQWPEALGTFIGMGAQGVPVGPQVPPSRYARIEDQPATIRPAIKVGAKAVGKTVAKVVARPAVGGGLGAAAGAAIGHATGIPEAGLGGAIIGRELGRDFSQYIRGRLDEQLGKPIANYPATGPNAPGPEEGAAPASAPPTQPMAPPPNPYASKFPEVLPQWRGAEAPTAPPAATETPTEAPATATAAAPATATAAEPPSLSKEQAARERRAEDLATFLHQEGNGITPDEARRMNPRQWQMANQGVESMRESAAKATTPSPATIKLAIDKLVEKWANTPEEPGPGAPPAGPPGGTAPPPANAGAWVNEMAQRLSAKGIQPLDAQNLPLADLDKIAADTAGGQPKLPPASKMDAETLLRMRQKLWDLTIESRPPHYPSPGYQPYRLPTSGPPPETPLPRGPAPSTPAAAVPVAG